MSSAVTAQPEYANKFSLDMVKGGTPSARQQLTMELVTTAHKDDAEAFVAGVPFPNFGEGDGVGPSVGQVLLFKPDAKVKATDFGPEVFAVRAAAEIGHMIGGLSDKSVQAKIELLNELAPTFAPTQVAASLECRDPKTHCDSREWQAEIGPTGYAGISKTTDGRKDTYWLVVHSSPAKLNEQLKQYVRNNPNMTYKQLMRDPIFSYARDMVKRNAQRIMANIRSAFRMKVGNGVYEDAGSVVAPHEMPPNVLKPDEQHYTSTIRTVYHNGQERVAVFNSVVPAENCAKRVVIDQGPWNGLVVYNTHNTAPALGYPASTRVTKHHSQVRATEEDRQLIMERAPYFTWTGKPGDGAISVASFPSVLLDGLHESVRRNDHFVDNMRKLGLKKSAPEAALLPVAMKVPTATEHRPSK